MKKIIYSIMLAVIVSVSVSSCTEENIKPQDGTEVKGSCNHGCQ